MVSQDTFFKLEEDRISVFYNYRKILKEIFLFYDFALCFKPICGYEEKLDQIEKMFKL